MRFGYAIAALLLVGCGSAESRTSITVSAAASLTGAFTEIADEFAAAHPDVDVALNFGSSGQLAAQIGDGAPADVAAFADTAAMDTLAKAGVRRVSAGGLLARAAYAHTMDLTRAMLAGDLTRLASIPPGAELNAAMRGEGD